MTAGKARRPEKIMRRVARIIVLIITAYGAIMLVGEAVSEFLASDTMEMSVEGIMLVVIGLVAVAGCVMSWLRDLPAAILLMATSAGLGAHIGVCAGRNHFLVWSILGLPYLISGVLMLYAWILSGRRG